VSVPIAAGTGKTYGPGYHRLPCVIGGLEAPKWPWKVAVMNQGNGRIPIKMNSARLDVGMIYPPWRLPIRITVPQSHVSQPLESPGTSLTDFWIEDPLKRPVVIDKSPPSNVKKEAARLIVIRRKKMNKHKLRKLRKRMKYVYAKVKLRREIRNEKLFLNTQMALIREAQKFDAKAYVSDILRRAKAEPLPTRWEGKYYPEPMIKEKMELDVKRKRQEYLSILDKRQK